MKAFCSKVMSADNITGVTEYAIQKEDILSVVIIKDDKVGVGGAIEVRLLS
jgi:hypothetical protein